MLCTLVTADDPRTETEGQQRLRGPGPQSVFGLRPFRDPGHGPSLAASCAMTAKGPLPGGSLTMEAKMGRNRVVVATLLVHSVNTATSRDRIKVMAAGGTECKGSICSPIHSDSPEALKAEEGGAVTEGCGPRELSPSCKSDSLSA